jgi:hypothetical protein
MSVRGFAQGFGRPPPPGGPASLAGPVDDLVDEIKQSDTWKGMWADAADKAYNQILTRFESDKQRLSDEIVSTAAPGLKQLAMETVTSVEPALKQDFIELFDDAQTQARIGQTQDEIRNSFIQVAAVGAITTILGTWLLVRYAGGR